MMKRFALLLALVFLPLRTYANLELVLKTHRVTKPPRDVKIIGDSAREERKTLRVTLGKAWAQIDDGTMTVIHDFEKRRSYRIDAQGAVDMSLFVHAGGRAVELDNRIYLAGIMADTMRIPLAEHELSLRKPDSPKPRFDVRTVRGEKQYLLEKKELLAWSTAQHTATAAERDAFVRFFRYELGGHPEILAALQREPGIPQRLRITVGMANETTTIDVMEARNTLDASYAPIAGKPYVDDEELAPLLAIAHAATSESLRTARTKILEEAVRAAGTKQPVAAILGFLEISFMTGERRVPEMEPLRDGLMRDANVSALLGALNPENAEQAKATVALLNRVQFMAPAKAHVAGLLRANHQQNLGDHNAAAIGYRAALKRNPLLTGVWNDYGRLLLNGYDAEAAWRCWDAARAIAPEHGLLDQVDELEARLVREQPGYF